MANGIKVGLPLQMQWIFTGLVDVLYLQDWKDEHLQPPPKAVIASTGMHIITLRDVRVFPQAQLEWEEEFVVPRD